MKKILSMILVIAMLCTLLLSSSADYGMVYTAKNATIVVDGEVDSAWENAEWTAVDKPFDGVSVTDSTLRVKLLWDQTHIYMLAEVYDSDLNEENDIVELYVDEKGDATSYFDDDDSQTRFKIVGGIVTGVNSGFNAQTNAPHVAKNLGNGNYLIEAAYTFTSDSVAGAGVEMGLEFMYNDGTATSDFVEAYRWNANTAAGDPQPSINTSAWGRLILDDETADTSSGSAPESSEPESSDGESSEPESSAPESSEPESSELESSETTSSDTESPDADFSAPVSSEEEPSAPDASEESSDDENIETEVSAPVDSSESKVDNETKNDATHNVPKTADSTALFAVIIVMVLSAVAYFIGFKSKKN